MEPLFEEEEDTSNKPPIVNAAAEDHGEETIEYADDAGLDLDRGSPP